MLERIVERQSIFPNMIEEIRQSKLPLIFYGAGIAANSIYTNMVKIGGGG